MDKAATKESRLNRLLRNTVSNYVGKFAGMIAWFLLTPFILGQLDPVLFGLWVLVGSIFAYGSLLDLGIAEAVTKYIAEFQAKGQLEQASRLVATALALYAILALLITAASVAVAPIFPRIFNVSDELRQTAYWLVVLSGLGMGLAILSASTTAVLRGLQRFDLMNLLGIVNTLLLAGATVAVLLLGGGVIGLVAATLAVNLVMQVPAVWLIYRIAPELRFGLAHPDREMLWKVTSFSSWLFVMHIGGKLQTKTDEIVIGAFLPVSAVTPYNLARRLSTLPQTLTEQFLSLLLPLASELDAENDRPRLRSLYIVSTRVTLGTFLTGGISLMVLAGPILTIWVGAEFAQYGYLIVILTLASLADIPTWPAGFIMQGVSRHRFIALISLATGAVNLILSLALIRPYGLLGVALGTLIPAVIFSFGFIIPYAMRVINVSASEMLRRAALPTLLPVIPAALVTYWLRELFEPETIAPTLLIGAVGSFLYLAGYLLAAGNDFERTLIQKGMSKTAAYAQRIRRDGFC
jgi:O-antigen/teichoic acid export membrane protein